MKIVRINAMWCPACIIMHKVWSRIEKEYQNIEYVVYDYDMDEEIVKKYNVGKILPVVIFYQNNVEIRRIIGEKTYEEIKDNIDGVITL